MIKAVPNTPETNLIETAAASGTFKTLRRALDAAELTDVLEGTGPYTLFAPTDEAFAKLPKGTLDGWLKPENKAQLVSVLKYHVMPGRASTEEVAKLGNPKSMQGEAIHVTRSDSKVSVEGAYLIGKDIRSSNGVIHAIDAVMQPKSATKH